MSNEHMNPDKFADSAGVPWEGRGFEPNPFAGDDGKADQRLIEAILALHAGTGTQVQVIDAFRKARVLIPLLANLGEAGEGAHGQTVDKSADLSIVTVETPDQQNGLPVFSSVEAMTAWNKDARPVPHSSVKAALAAAAEGNTRIVLDPGSATEFVIRRPAIEAIAKEIPWTPSYEDSEVATEFDQALAGNPELAGWSIAGGDPLSVLASAEVELTLSLAKTLTQEEFDALMQKIAKAISESAVIAERVDSLRVKLASA
jgi:hypothetical protein